MADEQDPPADAAAPDEPDGGDGDDAGRRPHRPHLPHLPHQIDEELRHARARAHEARVRLEAAAIEAELETGRREETVELARAGVIKRTVRIGIGSVVLFAGVLMLALPGPGWLVIALGLGILSRDVAWAERMLERVRRRLPQDEDGGVSKPVIATSVVVALAFVAGSIWLTLRSFG